MPAGGSRLPASHETVDQRLHYVHQDGQTVFKFAVRKTEEICRRLLDRNGLDARRRRSARVAPGQPPHHPARLREARHRAVAGGASTSSRYGNTTAATIPLALADARADGRLKDGDLRDADVGRRRLHRRRRAPALGRLTARATRPCVEARPQSRSARCSTISSVLAATCVPRARYGDEFRRPVRKTSYPSSQARSLLRLRRQSR